MMILSRGVRHNGRFDGVSEKPVKFGLFGSMFPPMDACLESIGRAEAAGWKFIDFPDQITSTNPRGMLKNPVSASDPGAPTSFFSDTFFGSMEMCAAAAVLTSEMEILLAVIDPLRRSPAVMAQEMMTLQHMSNGRMTFAIGAGEEKQFGPYGEQRTKPFTRLEEAVHIWQALWDSKGEPVDRESEFWPLTQAVFPIPMHSAGPPGAAVRRRRRPDPAPGRDRRQRVADLPARRLRQRQRRA